MRHLCRPYTRSSKQMREVALIRTFELNGKGLKRRSCVQNNLNTDDVI